MTADSSSQQERIKALEPLITMKLDELKETIDMRRRDEDKDSRRTFRTRKA